MMSGPRESLVSGRLLLAFASALLVTGITNAFPVFFPPLLAEFGGSRAATASTITLIWVGGAVLGPISGWAVVRWNPAPASASGSCRRRSASPSAACPTRSPSSASPSAWASGSAWD